MRPGVEVLRGSCPDRRACFAHAFDVAHTVLRDAEIIHLAGTGFTKTRSELGFVQATWRHCIFRARPFRRGIKRGLTLAVQSQMIFFGDRLAEAAHIVVHVGKSRRLLAGRDDLSTRSAEIDGQNVVELSTQRFPVFGVSSGPDA